MTSRLSDALLSGQAYSRGRMPAMLDPKYGGQNGWAPNLEQWVSTTHYVRKNMNCALIRAPKFFQYMPEPDFWISTLKSMVETHAKTIEGLKSTLSVDWAETNVGGANEVFQDIANVTRERSIPIFGWIDLAGRPFQNFLKDWILYGMMDPETKAPMYTTISGVQPKDQLNDMFTADMLFWEPDPTYTKAAKAWLCTNMMPKTAGDEEGKRDLTQAGDLLELNIEFSALSQTGAGPLALAQQVMDRIILANANPNVRTAFNKDVESDVNGSAALGYKGTVTQLSSNIVRAS